MEIRRSPRISARERPKSFHEEAGPSEQWIGFPFERPDDRADAALFN